MASNLEVTILVSEPLRPVLVLNPLWEKPTATAAGIQGFWGGGSLKGVWRLLYGDITMYGNLICSIASCFVC